MKMAANGSTSTNTSGSSSTSSSTSQGQKQESRSSGREKNGSQFTVDDIIEMQRASHETLRTAIYAAVQLKDAQSLRLSIESVMELDRIQSELIYEYFDPNFVDFENLETPNFQPVMSTANVNANLGNYQAPRPAPISSSNFPISTPISALSSTSGPRATPAPVSFPAPGYRPISTPTPIPGPRATPAQILTSGPIPSAASLLLSSYFPNHVNNNNQNYTSSLAPGIAGTNLNYPAANFPGYNPIPEIYNPQNYYTPVSSTVQEPQVSNQNSENTNATTVDAVQK